MTESDTTPSQRKRPPPTPLYRNTGGEAAIRAVYDRLLAALPYEHEQRLVQTSFGTAHVLVCGPVDAEPLVLWHGMGAPGPTMLEGFAPLISRFRTYVPDMPYQGASRSEDALLDPSTHEHGKWALEVLQGLGLVPGDRQGNKGALSNGKGGVPPVPLHAGVSFGGAVLLDLANVASEAIRGAALIVPGGLVPGSAWCMPCLLLPSMLYRLLPCPFTAWLALVGMCDEPVPEQLELILLEWRYVAAHSPLPGGNAGFSKAQLSRLTAPTLVIAAEKDVFWPGKAVAAAAEASLPACKTMVIPGRHLPSRAKLAECMEEVLSFWAVSKLI